MNDDEVKAWLSDDERRMWAQNGKPYMTTLMRTLAETRKMYMLLCVREFVVPMEVRERFESLGAQTFEDFAATMPRPKP